MTIIDKLISDGIINEKDKETVIARDCPFQYGYKDILKYGITFFKKKCMVKLKK